MDDVVAMQQAAQQRVRRMQERSRRLCNPTYGAEQTEQPSPSPAPIRKPKQADERWLLLLLLLMLSQNGGSRTLLILLAYLAM